MKSHLLTALSASLLCFGCAVADGPDVYDDTDAIDDNGEYTPDDDNSQTNAGSPFTRGDDDDGPSLSPHSDADDPLDPFAQPDPGMRCRDMDSREYAVDIAELDGEATVKWHEIEVVVFTDRERLDWSSNIPFKAAIIDGDEGQVLYEYPAGSDGAEGLTLDHEAYGAMRVVRFCGF